MIEPESVERFLDATSLDEIAEDELATIEEWILAAPEYAARYIAWLRSTLSRD